MKVLLLYSLFGLSFFSFFDRGLPKNVKIDYIEVVKEDREMHVYSKGKLLKTYKIVLGWSPDGPKRVQGDGKTPEGIYFINGKNPHSVAYKNLGISYPNSKDREEARKLGKSPGGDIKIHGLVNELSFLGKASMLFDWTGGCIAVNNSDMEELYTHVKVGAKIKIIGKSLQD
jgi:murein L,D-transpeptidase YafK